ncbi:MAG: SUMF1/EgtB/PvdO family nonheme iron enzyme [Chitinispirillales bacterium]|jgi:uncharacterized protein (TIGR02145 family)|nr:SUMF1/EgtB/PvdO family nonheme iron enzyme [Chitinispirillales bacterium]
MKTLYRYVQAPLFAAAVIAVCLSGCVRKAVHQPSDAGVAAADGGCGAAGILMESVDSTGAPSLTFIDSRDCRRYRAVKIGGDVWMAENLNYKTPRNSWCMENEESNCEKYGRLYDWETAKSICPVGWHLSTAEEWDRLLTAVDGKRSGHDRDDWIGGASKKLRAKSGWDKDEDDEQSGDGTDDYGFSALPGGERYRGGEYDEPGSQGSWWIADENNGSSSHNRQIFNKDLVFSGASSKEQGYSVRCVSDDGYIVKAGERGTFSLAVTAGSGGTAAVAPRKDVYAAGERVTLAAVPGDGYVFAGWTGGRVTDSASLVTSAAVRSDMAVTANFRRIDYGKLTDERDGKTYRTVKIGRQTWMAENLNYKPEESADESGCLDGKEGNCAKYGRLYDWHTATEVCPSGWYLPPLDDWNKLARYVGGVDVAGKKLKAANGWVGESGYRGDGTDAYGFSAQPGGGEPYRFENNDVFGAWWTTSRMYDWAVNARFKLHQNDLEGLATDKSDMYSVRCVMDEGGSLTLSAEEGGTVFSNPRKTSYKPGEQTTITAVPKSGYEFVKWTGGKVADPSSAVTTVTVRSNMGITAHFREIPSGGKDGKAGKTSVSGGNKSASARTEKHKIGKQEIEMVFVKGGTFKMGNADNEDGEKKYDDRAHNVTVGDFYIGKYEVTQKQWLQVMGGNPSGGVEGDDYPVNNISWYDIQEFIERLNAATGKKYRLPTEAEWEYAARGGSESKGYKYSGSDNPDDVAWHEDNSGGGAHPVGSKSPNELGIYDMSGNVWELVSDWIGDYGSSDQVNPTGPPTGEFRAGRGQYWGADAEYCKVYMRGYQSPGGSSYDTGFRLALPK